MQNLEGLKRKIEQADKYLIILNNDLKKFTDCLKEEFNINTKQAYKHLIEIEKKSNRIDKKINHLHYKAGMILKDIRE